MTVRDKVQGLRCESTTHAGLWLDRFLPSFEKPDGQNKGGPRDHVRELIRQVETPDVYRSHHQRWQTHLAMLSAADAARTAQATVVGRMAVGLGAKSVLEFGICLHRTYGVPVIPGSALKGLAARHARRLDVAPWRKDGDSYRALFGDHAEAGCVAFHDALWIPDKEPKLPLDLDVMTVHHATYYSSDDDTPPADSDDPNPVPFATARGTYLIALEGPPAWTDIAMALLKLALGSEGIGAKTAAGYGRLHLEYTSSAIAAAETRQRAAEAAAEQAKHALLLAEEQVRKTTELAEYRQRRVKELLRDLKVNNAGTRLPELLELAGDAERHAVALQCQAVLGKKIVRDAIKTGKKWVAPLATILYPDAPDSAP